MLLGGGRVRYNFTYFDRFEEGKLIENLNDTTSLTYESYKSTSTSKAFDMTLVEKIDCAADGEIIFACTSVDTPKVPKISGRNRHQVKLQGWILKQISRQPVATQVTFITQENIKGWIPGFTKKSLARKPLIIAAIDGYLQRKADRIKVQGHTRVIQPPSIDTSPSTLSISTHPSSKNSSEYLQTSPTLGKSAIPPRRRPSEVIILSNPPPRISSLSSNTPKQTKFPDIPPPIKEEPRVPPPRLYPASPHRNSRKKSFEILKSHVTSPLEEWTLVGQEDEAKMYTKTYPDSILPVMRSDYEFSDQWTVEQICSVIQCFGARKTWDESFEEGQVIERYSQKEYLIHIKMKSLFPIQRRDFSILTSIESNISSGAVYIASTSVQDNLIPVSESSVRASYVSYGWALIPQKNNTILVTMIAHLNMAGTTPLPSSIVRKLMVILPSSLAKIKRYLDQVGCPPYIRRVAGKITREEFENKQYSMTFIAKHTPSRRSHSSWCTDLRVHESIYPHGFQVNTHPREGVRVVTRQGGLRIFTESDALEGEKIHLTVVAEGEPEQLIIQDQIKDQIKNQINDQIEEKKEKRVEENAMSEDEPVVIERRHSAVIVITDDLTFSMQQFCFVILLMLICYYLGKFSVQCDSK